MIKSVKNIIISMCPIIIILAMAFCVTVVIASNMPFTKDITADGAEKAKIENCDFKVIKYGSNKSNNAYINIIRQKSTDVLYMQNANGGLEVMVQPDGCPMTYEIYKAEKAKIENCDFEVIKYGSNESNNAYINIIRQKSTDVLYMQNANGGLEVMVQPDGCPMTYEVYKKEINTNP